MPKNIRLSDWQLACLQEVLEKSDKRDAYDKRSYEQLVKIMANARAVTVQIGS